MKSLYIISAVALCLVAGCENDYHKFSHKLPSTNIKQDKSEGLVGIDLDKNGIRDDIDAFIVEQYTSREDRDAVSQMAKNVQSELLTSESTGTDELQSIYNQKIRAITCLSSKKTGKKGGIHEGIIKDILQLTLNTKQREQASKDFAWRVGSMPVKFPNEGDDGCDQQLNPSTNQITSR